jgi:phosphoglycerol transferase MdoB-like AlkP superfamily enzyme
MEFERIIFREEVIKEQELEHPEWTLEDGRLFRYATATRKNKERFFEFTITGTSHTPFRFSLEGHKRTFFPAAHDRTYTYFDTFNYVDAVIGRYVDELPQGTVVLIYGDHWSRVENPEIKYRSELIDEFGIVPAILFRKTGDGIEPLFEIDEKLAKSATLRLVDVTAWFRASLHIGPASAPPVAGLAAGQ